MTVKKPLKLSYLAALLFPALTLFHSNAAANINGVETVHVIPSKQPPAYDLEQIQTEATGTIKRMAVKVDGALAVLVIAKGFEGKGL